MNTLIDQLLSASKPVVKEIGPWDKQRPAIPARDEARISFLTPCGLHFGQGPIQVLAADPMAGPVLGAATQLMQALIAKSKSNSAR